MAKKHTQKPDPGTGMTISPRFHPYLLPLAGLVVFLLVGGLLVFFGFFSRQEEVEEEPEERKVSSQIEIDTSSDMNKIYQDDTSSVFLLSNVESETKGALYTLNDSSDVYIRGMLAQSSVKTDTTGGSQGSRVFAGNEEMLLPEDFAKNARLIDTTTDDLGNTHYQYQQEFEIEGEKVPVYNGVVSVHVDGEDNVYAVTGKTLQFDSYESPDLTAEEAEEIVREDVMTEYEIDTEKIEVSSNEKYILNTKFLGIDDNDKNYVGYVIDVVSGLSFSHRYLLGNKNIGVLSDYSTVAEYPNPIDVEEKIYDADLCGDNIDVSNFTLDNLTSDCIKLVFSNSDQSTYPVVESTTYVSFVHQGVVDFHNSIKERYNRNSYDNANGAYRVVLSNTIGGGYTHMNNNMNIIFATNRTLTDRDLLNLEAARNYTKGVVFHEYGHKVVESTANFEYILEHQSGALHEAYAGFFLMSTINEWNTYGYFYDHDWYEPHYTSYLDGARYDLDGNFLSYHDEEVFFLELFSSHYACNSDNYSPAHHNNPVIMHTWALMSEGSENAHGCQLQGIGKEKTFQIGYRALTTPGYMHASSNYYNWYWAMKHACRDFAQVGGHGITDEDCINVERAMQATKIDQQPVDKPKGPTCYGIEPRVAACVNTPPPGGQSSSEQPENPVPEDDEERSEEPEQDQPSGSGPCDNNAMMPHFRGCYEDGGRMIGVCGMYSEGDCVSTEECEEKAREEGRELPVETLVYDISPDLCGSVQQEEPQEPTSVPESSEIGDNEEIGDTGEKLVCGSHTAPDDRKYVDPCDPCESNSECGGDEPWCHGGFCLE